MKRLKGKCKTCLGCNKLNEVGFKGVDECKHYINGTDNKKIIIWILAEFILLFALGYAVYTKISMIAGG